MKSFDPVAYLRAVVDEYLTFLHAPPQGVDANGISGHASGAVFGAAQVLMAAGMATSIQLQAELDRFTDALVDGGFAERVTASASTAHSMSAIRAGKAPPPQSPDPAPGPPALQQVIPLNRALVAGADRTLWATSIEQWSDGLLLHWTLTPRPGDFSDPLVRSLVSSESWSARDDLGFEHSSKEMGSSGRPARLGGFVLFRGAPAPGARSVTISLREDRDDGEHGPGDELFAFAVPID